MDYEDMATAEQSKSYLYALDASGKPYVPSFLTWNLKARHRLSDLVQLMVGVENITDLRYRPYSSGISAPGRNVIGSVRLRF
jgi:hemoglobin/transferrin/lactoferrin receptor protein